MSLLRRRMMMANQQKEEEPVLDYFTIVAEEEGVRVDFLPLYIINYVYDENFGDYRELKNFAPFFYKIGDNDWVYVDGRFSVAADSYRFDIPLGSKLQIKGEYADFIARNLNEEGVLRCPVIYDDSCIGFYSIEGTVSSLYFGEPINVPIKDFNVSDRAIITFDWCEKLRRINNNKPLLPFTELFPWCYYDMFHSCTNLLNAPTLPATKLSENCYESMFLGCENLSYIKMLATDISAKRCLDGWVNNVSPTGTFVKNKNATWDVRGYDGIPNGWTVITE